MKPIPQQPEPGHRVTYLDRRPASTVPHPRRRGTVTGHAVFDAYTNQTWVPVHADGLADDVEPRWVTTNQIIDVEAPRSP
ncbi:MAG TPA: hypothetical protein VJ870_14575 [Amycolatopsis sp.]|nr:hypothetical protein [Amycolatopsis sp.]